MHGAFHLPTSYETTILANAIGCESGPTTAEKSVLMRSGSGGQQRGQHREIYHFLGVEILRQGPFFTQESQVAAHFFQVDAAVGRKNADEGLVRTFRLAWVDS